MRKASVPPAFLREGKTMKKVEDIDNETFHKGLNIRREVLGTDYVDAAISKADEDTWPLQELVTTYCWGAVWGRDTLPRKTRSIINIAMITALNRPHELKLHVRGALNNGLTKQEIYEILLQTAVYCGVPAAIDGMRIAKEVITEEEANAK
jgi:4-carboxymuconolactone decarboxylase